MTTCVLLIQIRGRKLAIEDVSLYYLIRTPSSFQIFALINDLDLAGNAKRSAV